MAEEYVEANPHVQASNRLTIDAAERSLTIETVLGRRRGSGPEACPLAFSSADETSPVGKAPGQIVPPQRKQPRQPHDVPHRTYCIEFLNSGIA